MHQHSTSGIRRRKIRIRRWHSTCWHGTMRGCGLTSCVVCINDKFCDIRERNVTIRSEIWTMNILFLGFREIREYVTLLGLILQSLGCRYPTYFAVTVNMIFLVNKDEIQCVAFLSMCRLLYPRRIYTRKFGRPFWACISPPKISRFHLLWLLSLVGYCWKTAVLCSSLLLRRTEL